MATTGYIKKAMASSLNLVIYYSIEQSIEDNTSTITISYGVEKKDGITSLESRCNVSAKYNGTSVYTNSNWLWQASQSNPYQYFYTTTRTVSHNINGTKTITLYAYINPEVTGYDEAEIDTTLVLPTIQRAGAIYATNANIGENSQINIDRKDSRFTSTVSYKIEGQSSFTTIKTKTTETSFQWTIPAACYTYMSSNSKTVNIILQCVTYYGSTQIQEAQTTTIAARATAADCNPTVTPTFSFGSSTNTLTGATDVGILNYSTLTTNIAATAKNNATISKIVVTHNGTSKTGASNSFAKIGADNFSYTVTDSRGFSTSGNVTFSVVDYFAPSVTIEATPPSATTGNTVITVSGSAFNGSFGATTNTITVQYQYKTTNASSYTSVTVSTTKTDNTFTGTAQVLLDYTQAYDIRARIKDSANTSYIYSAVQTIKTYPIINWGKDFINLNVPTSINAATQLGGNVTLSSGNTMTLNGGLTANSTITANEGLDIASSKYITTTNILGDSYNLLGTNIIGSATVGDSNIPLILNSSAKIAADVGLDAPILYENGTSLATKYQAAGDYIETTTYKYFGSGTASGAIGNPVTKSFTDSLGCAFYVLVTNFGSSPIYRHSMIIPKNRATGQDFYIVYSDSGTAMESGWNLTKSGTTITVGRPSGAGSATFYLWGIK